MRNLNFRFADHSESRRSHPRITRFPSSCCRVQDSPQRSRQLRGSGSPLWVGLSQRLLLPREHGRQIPEFGFYFSRIGYGIRNFLAKKFAIPFAKPVNCHLERSL